MVKLEDEQLDKLFDCCQVTTLLVKSIISRSIFVFYGFVAVWRVTVTTNSSSYWLLLITLVPVCLEMVYFVAIRRPSSFKW